MIKCCKIDNKMNQNLPLFEIIWNYLIVFDTIWHYLMFGNILWNKTMKILQSLYYYETWLDWLLPASLQEWTKFTILVTGLKTFNGSKHKRQKTAKLGCYEDKNNHTGKTKHYSLEHSALGTNSWKVQRSWSYLLKKLKYIKV